MLSFLRISLLPIPELKSTCGVLIDPADKTISLVAVTDFRGPIFGIVEDDVI